MNLCKEESHSGSEIDALDPDLPFLASEAAVDLANLRHGGPPHMEAIHELAERLKKSIKRDQAGVPSYTLIDPDTLTILSGALASSFSPPQPVKKINNLLSRALEIADFLSSVGNESDPAKLEEAMKFCAALSRATIALRRSMRELRPSHPFRR